MKFKPILIIASFIVIQKYPVLHGSPHPVQKSRASLSGKIINKETGTPIPDANIIVENTPYGAASGDGGYFTILNLPAGTYDITVSVIGFDRLTRTDVLIGGPQNLDFALSPAVVELDPVLVSATLSDHLQSHVSVHSHVLTRTRINEKNGDTVGEVTESVGGLYMKNYDGFAGPQMATIRGSNVDQVLVLLDGLRLNTTQGGGVDLNSFPVSMLDRIEIIRGGHSAIMGTNAMGGVIHLISRDALTPRGFYYGLNATAGAFGMQSINSYGAQKIGPVACFFNYNHTQTDGDFEYRNPDTGETATRQNNDFDGDNFFFKAKAQIGGNNHVQVIYQNFRNRRGIAGSTLLSPYTQEPMLTPDARSTETRHLVSLRSENQLFPWLRLEEQVYHHALDYHYTHPSWFIDERHENVATGVNIQAMAQLMPNLRLVVGSNIHRDGLSSNKFDTDDRLLLSGYVQAEIVHSLRLFGGLQHVTLIPAVRMDDYSDVGSNASPKIGILTITGDDVQFSIKGNIGQSYRAPSFNDLYWPVESYGEGWGGAVGNPGLRPERGMNVDVGFSLTRRHAALIRFELAYYANRIKDLIQWRMGDDLWWSPVNVGKSRISGLETGVTFRTPGHRAYVRLFHSWMKAIDESDGTHKGKRLIYRPEHTLNAMLGTRLGPFGLNLDYRIVSKRFTTQDNTMTLPAYTLMNGNMTGSFRIGDFQLDVKVQVMNILDRSVFLLDGYPLPGREFRVTLGILY